MPKIKHFALCLFIAFISFEAHAQVSAPQAQFRAGIAFGLRILADLTDVEEIKTPPSENSATGRALIFNLALREDYSRSLLERLKSSAVEIDFHDLAIAIEQRQEILPPAPEWSASSADPSDDAEYASWMRAYIDAIHRCFARLAARSILFPLTEKPTLAEQIGIIWTFHLAFETMDIYLRYGADIPFELRIAFIQQLFERAEISLDKILSSHDIPALHAIRAELLKAMNGNNGDGLHRTVQKEIRALLELEGCEAQAQGSVPLDHTIQGLL